MKTNELTGAALDFAVAKCEGRNVQRDPQAFHDKSYWIWEDKEIVHSKVCYLKIGKGYSPSTDWAQGGPIIERERLLIQPEINCEGAGNAWYAVALTPHDSYGPTPLIAAMRCYVASKLGDIVDIPKGLLK